MLVLSRKENESVVIGDDVTVIVVRIHGGTVLLGFEAPGEIPVHRREVYDDIHKNDPPTGQKP